MTKTKTNFVCQTCGASYRKWQGHCGACDTWDNIHEETSAFAYSKSASSGKGTRLKFETLEGEEKQKPRVQTSMDELDRVLGGGLVNGSAILIGGDPGIGKSTLLLQLAARLSLTGASVAYVSGEESIEQVRLRALRLNYKSAPVHLLSSTSVEDIIATASELVNCHLLIIDSIQTMFLKEFSSAPGTVSQVRASAHELINFAKKTGTTVVLVGHVTKDGQIAGPKVLEHMVDTVLYFEGDRGHQFRILRAVKNRFGGVNEIGVFEMRDFGLQEVSNPSELFLSQYDRAISGTSVFAGIEGTRPLLVEVQGLIAPSYMAAPRRAAVGWDTNRLAMIIAVLGSRYGLFLGDKEVYLNIAGGLKIVDPAADLAVVASLLSAASNKPLPDACIVFGEIGLSGEIRKVSQQDARIKEAIKLGFKNAIVPRGTRESMGPSSNDNVGIELHEIGHIKQLKDWF